MMSYLLLGTLLIIGSRSQDTDTEEDGIPQCEEVCDSGYVCDVFAGAFSRNGTAECVPACTADPDCEDRDSGLITPYCDTTSGICQVCLQNSQCNGTSIFGGANATYCASGAPILDINICSEEPSRLCSSTSECEANWGKTAICVEYTNTVDDDLSFGACLDPSDDDAPAGICTAEADCANGGPWEDDPDSAWIAEFDLYCTPIEFPADIAGTEYEITFSFCLPEDQCEKDEDCLTGSICRDFNFDDDGEGDSLFSVCWIANTTCSDAADCNEGDATGPLECYAKDDVCYLPCETSEECRTDTVDNWACGSPPNTTDVQGCIPLGLPNATYVTFAPTSAPRDGPDGVKSLQIFGAFIIMVINFVFN